MSDMSNAKSVEKSDTSNTTDDNFVLVSLVEKKWEDKLASLEATVL